MRVHRDRKVAFFLAEFLRVTRHDQAARTIRDWAERKLYLETCLGDGYSLLEPGNRDIGYAIDLLISLRVPRRRVLRLAYVIGHLHGLRPSLREMDGPAVFERTIERKYRLVSNISSKDLALVHQNIEFENNDSISEIIGLLKACNAAGLDAYGMMDAHAAGLPIEYALAISREGR